MSAPWSDSHACRSSDCEETSRASRVIQIDDTCLLFDLAKTSVLLNLDKNLTEAGEKVKKKLTVQDETMIGDVHSKKAAEAGLPMFH